MHDYEARPRLGPSAGEQVTEEQILLAAAAKGDCLRISYDEGSQPGTIREIRPVRIQGPYLFAFDGQTARPKKFRLEFLTIEPADAEITYRPRRIRRVEVDPRRFFAGFAFEVAIPAFLPAFDFMLSERIVTVRGVKRKRKAWTQGSPPQFQFDEGDLFSFPGAEWRKSSSLPGEQYALQVRGGNHKIMLVAAFARIGSKWSLRAEVETTPREFVDLLRDGPHDRLWEIVFPD